MVAGSEFDHCNMSKGSGSPRRPRFAVGVVGTASKHSVLLGEIAVSNLDM